MKRHDAFLELAAVAIDFPLSPAERSRLNAHLAGCAACARSASHYRADAAAIADLPRITLPERRAALVLEAALHPSSRLTPLRLVAVVALLVLAMLGSLWAGSQVVRLGQDEDLGVVPVPVETRDPDGSPVTAAGEGLPAPLVVTTSVKGADGADTSWIAVLEPGGRLTPLAEGRDGAWLDRSQVVYSCGDEAASHVCVVPVADPEFAEVLVPDAARPVPAPDGSTIAVHRGSVDVGETWLSDANGGALRLLGPGDFGRWSPDGRLLVGQSEGTTYQLALAKADGTELSDWTPGYDPAWSPDGARVAYALVGGFDSPDVAKLLTVEASDGAIKLLYTAGPGESLNSPVWLDDGAIVFVRDSDIVRLDAGATEPVALTRGAGVNTAGYTQSLELSPDGQWIAYTATRDGSPTVEAVTVDGSASVSFPIDKVYAPRWGPIGAAVPPSLEPSATPGSQTPPAVTPKPGTGTAEGYAWSEVEVPSTPTRPVHVIEAVSTGAGGFVAVGRTCMGGEADLACEAVALVSPDGRAWQRAPVQASLDVGGYVPTSGPEVGMFDVVGGANGVVAVGNVYGERVQPTAWFSADGLAWQRVALAADDRFRVNAVTWDGQRYVAVGEDRSEWDGTLEGMTSAVVRAAAWTSPDGVTWTRAPASGALVVGDLIDTTEDPMSGGMADVVEGPGGLVAVGSACTAAPRGCEPAAWRSDDGLAWQRLGGLPAVSGGLSAVATQGGETPFIAVGRWDCGETERLPGGGCPALVLASGDLASWTRQASFPQAGDLRTITWVGDRFLATAPDGPETVWASSDGFEWSAASMPGGPATTSEDGGISEWQFAATPGTAVWMGVPMASDRAAAWVSPPSP